MDAVTWTVEAATALFVPALASMHEACFETPWSELDIAGVMAMPGAFALVARRGAGAAEVYGGFALAVSAADECEILSIGTIPAERRCGAASALMTQVFRSARERGARAVFLEVDETNIAARRLYLSLGFQRAGRRANYYRSGNETRDAHILRKCLDI